MLPHLFQADRVWLHCRYLTSDMAQGFFGRSWEGSEAGRFQITCSKPSIWIVIPLSISVTDKRNEFTNLTVRCIRGCIIKSSIQVGWLEVATSYVTRSTRLHGMIIHPGKINFDIQNRYISAQSSLQVMLPGVQLSFSTEVHPDARNPWDLSSSLVFSTSPSSCRE